MSHGDALSPRPKHVEAKKSLRNMLEVLRRGKWLILSVLALTLAGAVLYVATLPPPVFRARTLLMLETQPSSGNDALNFGFVNGPGFGSRNVTNQTLILQQSLGIAEQTADRLIAMQTVPATGERLSVLGPEEEPLSRRDLAVLLQRFITVTPLDAEAKAGSGSDGIWVSATSTVPAEAVLIANLYAEEYVRRTQETSRQRITGSRLFLEEQKTKRQEELRQIEEQIKQMNQGGAIALDAETNRSISQIAQLEAALDEARIDLSMREAALRSAEQELQQLQPKLTQRLASGVEKEIDLNQTKIAQLEVQLEQTYLLNPELRNAASENKDIRELNSQINQLKERVRQLSEQYIEEMMTAGGLDPRAGGTSYVAQLNQQIAEGRIGLSGVQAKIQALEQRLAAYSRKLDSIPAQSMQIAQLQRARQSTEQLYIHLVEKLQEARIAEESEVGFAQVIRPALHPEGPVGANKPRYFALGMLLGLLLGIGAAAARHRLDTRIYTPDDLHERKLNLIGVVPDMRPAIKKEHGKKAKVSYDGREVSTTLAPLLRRLSPSSESYRRLYLNLQFSRPDAVVQTVLITSPEAGAGKSTTALNLAVTAAQAGKRTLLIDADLRLPVLHDLLGIPPQPGLRELLLKPASAFEAERFTAGIENLYVITTHTPVPNSARLLGSREMREFIEQLRIDFDLIIFDSPPVLVASDAVLLATQCDVTLVVTAAGGTDADALVQTLGELKNVGAQIAGTVLNRFDPSYIYGYKTTYGYRYGYAKSPYTQYEQRKYEAT